MTKAELASLATLARDSRVPVTRVEPGARTMTERAGFLVTRDPLERKGAMTEREIEARNLQAAFRAKAKRLARSKELRAWYRRGLRCDYVSPMSELDMQPIELRAYKVGRAKARKIYA